jgi:hypothetical protein
MELLILCANLARLTTELVADASLFWKKSNDDWYMMADLFWEKSTAGW